MQNQAAILYGVRDVRVEETSMPVPGPREVLVEIASVGVCGSDMHYYEHGKIGAFVVRAPLILGHESSGVVAQLGAEASKHAVGDRVTIEPGVPCGRCRECRSGRYNLCQDVRFFATPPIDGAFARYVTVHEDFAFRLPDGMSDDEGALIEPLSVGLWACRKAKLEGGDRVLVTGAGPIGILAMQAALALGATEATITDVNAQRLEMARQLGATRALNVAEEPLGEVGLEFDVLIECSGIPSAMADGIHALRPGGVAVAVGLDPSGEVSIPMAALQTREITLMGVFRYANTYPGAIALAASGRVNLGGIVTGHYPLEQAEEALQAGRKDPASVKAMVRPGA